MAPPPRIYLCATEWVGLLNGEQGAETVQALVDRASAGEFEIVGSELLYAEVLHHDGEALLDRAVRIWAAVDHRVALRTRAARLEAIADGRSAKTPDLIHVATAELAQVAAFITTDDTCRTLAAHVGVPAFNRGEYPTQQTLTLEPWSRDRRQTLVHLWAPCSSHDWARTEGEPAWYRHRYLERYPTRYP